MYSLTEKKKHFIKSQQTSSKDAVHCYLTPCSPQVTVWQPSHQGRPLYLNVFSLYLSDLGMDSRHHCLIFSHTYSRNRIYMIYWNKQLTIQHISIKLLPTSGHCLCLLKLSWISSFGILLSLCLRFCISLSIRTFLHIYLHSPYTHSFVPFEVPHTS